MVVVCPWHTIALAGYEDSHHYLVRNHYLTAAAQCPTPIFSECTCMQASLESWNPVKWGESLSRGAVALKEDGNMSGERALQDVHGTLGRAVSVRQKQHGKEKEMASVIYLRNSLLLEPENINRRSPDSEKWIYYKCISNCNLKFRLCTNPCHIDSYQSISYYYSFAIMMFRPNYLII